MAAGENQESNLDIFENAVPPLTALDKIAAQIKNIDWESLVTTGWGTVRISVQAGKPALVQWENSIRIA